MSIVEDANMLALARANEGDIFASAEVVAMLMTASRSQYGFDFLSRTIEGHPFLVRRDETVTPLQTCLETASGVGFEEEGQLSPKLLALECTYVHDNFIQTALRDTVVGIPDAENVVEFAPQAPNSETAPSGFVYRRYSVRLPGDR